MVSSARGALRVRYEGSPRAWRPTQHENRVWERAPLGLWGKEAGSLSQLQSGVQSNGGSFCHHHPPPPHSPRELHQDRQSLSVLKGVQIEQTTNRHHTKHENFHEKVHRAARRPRLPRGEGIAELQGHLLTQLGENGELSGVSGSCWPGEVRPPPREGGTGMRRAADSGEEPGVPRAARQLGPQLWERLRPRGC